MKRLAVLLPLAFAIGSAFGADAATTASPSATKAECDAVLNAEVRRLEDGFSRTRVAWEQTVEQRFHEHTELTIAQEKNARETFDDLVLKLSNEHVKAVALPGIYRMMLSIPRYDLNVCSRPAEMRSIGDQAIAGFLLKLTELLPFVEKTIDAAKSDS
ncbi:MAG: hypothetical protein WDO68_03315 [Gammaproteobacteria bacterium]